MFTKTESTLLKAAKTNAVLITNLTNIRYLTGVPVSAGFLLIRKRKTEFFVDGRYTEAARTATQGIRVRNIEDFVPTLQTIKKVAIESSDITLARYEVWKKKFKKTKFIITVGLVEELRRVKSKSELASIAAACRITKRVLKDIPSLLKSGISERGLAQEIERRVFVYGGDGLAFDTIVGFGEHTARPHHHPTDRTLKKGDLVQIDMGARKNGYCSDYSRIFYTGSKTSAQVRAEKALKQAKKFAEKMVKPGVKSTALDREARRVLKTFGFDSEFSHSLGHALGLDIHEAPTISEKAKPVTLKRHEVITIEPGLYFEGEWGMRIEDTIVVE